MSKYNALWEYIDNEFRKKDITNLEITFRQIKDIIGVEIDHSFLTYKKELSTFGYKVSKISLKNNKINIEKII
jgi:ppGpp synthetase/RelA/SpoT-type nucleotidyltranferase